MKIITCASYYGTGSSAITDYVSEFDSVFSFTDEEFRFIQDPDGISDLEYNLIENHNRHNSGHALKRFKRLVDLNSGNFFKKGYEPFFNYCWKKLSYEFIDDLTDFTYKGWWQYDLIDRGQWFYFRKRIVNKILHLTIWKKNPERVYNSMKNEITYCSKPNEEKFIVSTKKYITGLISAANVDNKETVVMDQLLAPTNLKKTLRYFDNIKVVVVDRDPRDVYLLAKYQWKDGIIPTQSAELFCKWYKYTRAHRKHENMKTENICFVQFEDLIYKYDETCQKLNDFLGLDYQDHINKFKFFNPDKSIKNTRLWKKSEDEGISIITAELKEYLYE